MSGYADSDVELQSPVDQWVQAFNTGNVTAIVALYTVDAELSDSGMPRTRHGQREIERWFTLRFRSMPSNIYTPTSQAYNADGEIRITWTLYGRGPRLLGQAWLARPFQADGVSRFRLRDGYIYWQEGTYDHLAVLRQIVPLFRWCPAALARLVYSFYMRLHGQI
ncbi:MAG TPA: nuclear transport factor 2 family protein [Ktedonosporobacter sp.]|nr:nuclear transport factor 2 family protein [Ktedonosporobacter sp.]